MNDSSLRVGISTCPNDTFAFHALLEGQVDALGLVLEIEFGDIEELNRRLIAGELDVAKASYHLAFMHSDQLIALPVGSAIGFGVGPLLVGAPGFDAEDAKQRRVRVLLPGEHTTATLLWHMFGAVHAPEAETEQVLFSEIFPRLEAGSADLGVCIHEGRFTWKERGLVCCDDFGQRFETLTSAPLPLGGLFARGSLDRVALRRLGSAVRASLEWGRAHRKETLPTLRRHAQELSDAVLWKHVDLYVNEWTLDLGREGRRAIAAFEAHARSRAALGGGGPEAQGRTSEGLRVLSP